MNQLQRIRSHLTTQPALCDDCLAKTLGIHPRQTVNAQCRKAGSGVRRTYSVCSGCKAGKLVNDLGEAPSATMSSSSFKRSSKPSQPSHHYSREDDLRQRLNNSLCEALNLPKQDYYGRLNLDRLLLLKGCLARVHDVITLKLTQVLVKWVSRRFGLTPEQITVLQTKVDEQHPNASGFDLDSPDLNLVAEVKGNIPVNRRKIFGSAQLNGLTNDVLQMLGKPPNGKVLEKMKLGNKVKREGLDTAIKLLCLCDTPEVRIAAHKWGRNLMARASWKQMGDKTIQEVPSFGNLSPDTVYLVYLAPIHLQPQQD